MMCRTFASKARAALSPTRKPGDGAVLCRYCGKPVANGVGGCVKRCEHYAARPRRGASHPGCVEEMHAPCFYKRYEHLDGLLPTNENGLVTLYYCALCAPTAIE